MGKAVNWLSKTWRKVGFVTSHCWKLEKTRWNDEDMRVQDQVAYYESPFIIILLHLEEACHIFPPSILLFPSLLSSSFLHFLSHIWFALSHCCWDTIISIRLYSETHLSAELFRRVIHVSNRWTHETLLITERHSLCGYESCLELALVGHEVWDTWSIPCFTEA